MSEKATNYDKYKFLLEMLHKLGEQRDRLNSFYVSLNSYILAFSTISNNFDLAKKINEKTLFNATILIGVIITVSWISSLLKLNKMIDIYENNVTKEEETLDIQIFSVVNKKKNRTSPFHKIAIYELIIPIAFLCGFLFFSLT